MISSSFKIYNASAGSGKTFQLAQNYVGLIIARYKSQAYKEILALTFTNKAVGEMKDRILSVLSDFAQGKENPMLSFIASDLNLNSTEVRHRAQYVLKDILHNYGYFELSTIDKFTHKILRTFAIDLKLNSSFEVVIDPKEIIREAINRTINQIGIDENLTEILTAYTFDKVQEGKNWNIAFKLQEESKVLLEDSFRNEFKKFNQIDIEHIINYRNQFFKSARNCEEKVQVHRIECEQFLQKHNITAADCRNQTYSNWLTLIKQQQWENDKLKENKILGRFEKKTVFSKNVTLNDFELQEIEELSVKLNKEIVEIYKIKSIIESISAFTILQKIYENYKSICDEEELLPISEFNAVIAKEIKNQPTPYLYERLGEKFKHFFLDEFQDTSVTQWQNLIPLFANGLEGIQEDNQAGSLFIVGDAKQAIYRWRDGHAEQLIELSQDKNNPFSVKPKTITLQDNYRSSRTIVKFNNSFFKNSSTVFEYDDYRQLYADKSGQNPKVESEGKICIHFLKKAEKTSKQEPHLIQLKQDLQNVIQKGYQYKDCAVLVQRNSEAQKVAQYLNEENVPLISAEALLIKNHPAINFLIAILKFVLNTKDQEAAFEIFDFIYVNDEKRFEKTKEALTRPAEQLKTLGFDADLLKNESCSNVLHLTLAQFKFPSNPDAYIAALVEEVHNAARKQQISVASFLSYWSLKSDKISAKVPSSINAVQINTIHSAKGLEYPLVFLPFFVSPSKTTNQKMAWFDIDTKVLPINRIPLKIQKNTTYFSSKGKDVYDTEVQKTILDKINLMYVAFTRPINGLFVYTNKVGKDSKAKMSYEILLANYCGLFEEGLFDIGVLPKVSKQAEEEHLSSLIYQTSQFFHWQKGNYKKASFSSASIEKGEIVHHKLALIEKRSDLKLLELELSEEEHWVYEKCQAIVNHPQLSAFYKEDVIAYNERPITQIDGSVSIPDRIIFSDSNVAIIDYKTGKVNISHEKQIEKYALILSHMGYDITHKILVYIDDEITIKSMN